MATTVLDTLITRFLYAVDASQLDKATATLGRAQQRADELGNSLMAAGAILTGALAGVGVKVMQFEENLNAVQAAGEFTKEEMVRLREEAQRMGASTAFSAAQAAEAQLELAQAGYSAVNIAKLLPEVLNLAAAGSLSMADAATVAKTGLKGFNLESREMGRISDVLAKAASSSNTTVLAMGMAFSKASSTAANANVPLEATAAMLSVIQDRGIGAEIAGTGLSSMFTKLSVPTKEATKAFQEMGITKQRLNRYIEQGDIVGLFKAMKKGGLDIAKSAAIFGLEYNKIGLILANNADVVENLNQTYLQAEGTSKRMAETKMQGLPGAFKETTSVMEGFVLEIGKAGLTGQIEELLHFVRNLFDMLSKLPAPILQILGWVLLAGPALLSLGMAFKAAAFAAGGLQAVLALLSSTGLAAILKEFVLVARATNLWTAAQWLLNGAMAANPLGLIIGAVVALGAALIRVIAIWQDLKKAWEEDGLMGAVGRFFNFFGDDEEEEPVSKDGPPSQTQQALAQVGAYANGQNQLPSSPVGGASTTTNSTVRQDNSVRTVHVDKVEVSVPNGDAKQIASNVAGELKDQSRRVHQGFDSKIAE